MREAIALLKVKASFLSDAVPRIHYITKFNAYLNKSESKFVPEAKNKYTSVIPEKGFIKARHLKVFSQGRRRQLRIELGFCLD